MAHRAGRATVEQTIIPLGRERYRRIGEHRSRILGEIAGRGPKGATSPVEVNYYLGATGLIPDAIQFCRLPRFQAEPLDLLREGLGVTGPRECLVNRLGNQGVGRPAGHLRIGVIGDHDVRLPDAQREHELSEQFFGSSLRVQAIPGGDEIGLIGFAEMLRDRELPKRFAGRPAGAAKSRAETIGFRRLRCPSGRGIGSAHPDGRHQVSFLATHASDGIERHRVCASMDQQ